MTNKKGVFLILRNTPFYYIKINLLEDLPINDHQTLLRLNIDMLATPVAELFVQLQSLTPDNNECVVDPPTITFTTSP